MKKLTQSSALLIVTFFIFITGCKKTETATGSTTVTTDPTSAIISGTWAIGSYTQKTEDKTSLFNGTTFTFSSNGSLGASGNNSATGTWSYIPPSSTYYGSQTGSFNINLGASTPFIKITKAWNIGSQTSTSLRLDNKEPLEDEHITFSKK